MDVLHDNSYRKLHQIALVVGPLPSYVGNYTILDEKQASELSDRFFADESGRQFPIDSPENTWLSATYLALQKAELPMKQASVDFVEAKIKEAAQIYGIAEDVKKAIDSVTMSLTMFDKAAATDEEYGWIVKDASGAIVAKRYLMRDVDGVRKAAAYFEENRHHYPLDVRRMIASNIVKRAETFAVDQLPGCVAREAGLGIPRTSVLMRELLERAELAKDAENSVLLANVNNLISTLDQGTLVDHLDKVAEVIDTFDRVEDLTKYYGTRIMPPADFLYGVNLKEASAFVDNSIRLHRWTFDITKLAQIDPELFAGVLGPQFMFKVAKEIPGKFGDENGYHFEAAKLDPKMLQQELVKLSQADKASLEEALVAICE